MKSIRFYAVESDWFPVFEYLETKYAVLYTATSYGYMYERLPPRYEFGRLLPNLGIATGEQTLGCDSYVVTHMDTTINIRTGMVWEGREHTVFNGRERFDIHGVDNPDSVRLIAAGRWNNMIVEGIIDTMFNTEKSQALMRAFSNPMRKHFKRVNARWVGPEAYREWTQGRRLASAEQSPPEYDLKEATK